MRSRWIPLIAFALLTLVVLACGGAANLPAVIDTPTPTATPEPPATPTTAPEPAFGPITFGLGVVDDTNVVRDRTVFPEGIYRVFASFDYTDIPIDAEWRREWYYNDELMDSISLTEAWPHDKHGATWLSTFNDEGLDPGVWELKLYINDELAQSGLFEVEERRPDAPVFKPITFAKDVTADFEPVDPADEFDNMTSTVHGIFNAENLTEGMTFDRVWYYNGNEALRGTETVTDLNTDVYDASIFVDDGTLDPGVYTLEIEFDGELMQGQFIYCHRVTLFFDTLPRVC